jgi:hypothetical protein
VQFSRWQAEPSMMAEVNHKLESRLSDEAVTQRMQPRSLTVTSYQFQP